MVIRRLARWKRIAVSRLSLHHPAFLRFLPTPRPLEIRHCRYDGAPARDLLVCLPGIGDEARDFEDWGFVEMVRAHPWATDVLLVDAHYGYYADRTILEQLHRDVLVPASIAGYRSIWLTGISMGGLGALLYARQYPNDIRAVVAIAPFLGTRTLIEEISAAGGLLRWRSTLAASDEIRAVWTWLGSRSPRGPAGPEIFLAFGDTDPFASAHRLLASILPPAHVITARGGHRWPVWRTLWKEFLRRHGPRDDTDQRRLA